MKTLLLKQKQIFFFVLAGGLSAILEVGSFKFFSVSIPKIYPSETDWHGIHFPLSNILSTSIGIISNYFFSIWFVFESGKHSKRREFAYFIVLSVISALLSLTFFQVFFTYVFKDNLDLIVYTLSPEVLSKVSAILLVSILNFTLKKKIVFNG